MQARRDFFLSGETSNVQTDHWLPRNVLVDFCPFYGLNHHLTVSLLAGRTRQASLRQSESV